MSQASAENHAIKGSWLDARMLHLVLILGLAVALRCWRLNHWSLWYDEVVTARLAQAAGPAAMIELLGRIDATRAPLFPLLLMGWCKGFGDSDLAARSLSAWLGVLTVVAVYGLGRSALDERTGRWAAWLCALCPPLVYYSQEVRMYALLVPLTVGSWWTFLAFRHSASSGHVLGYAALLAALIYTQPVSLFMVAAHGAAYLAVRRSLTLRPRTWLLTLGLAGLLVAPWVGRYLDHPPESITPRYPIRYLLGVPIGYLGGNSLTLLPLACLIAAGLFTFQGKRPVLRDPVVGPALVCWFMIPPVLIYAYSLVGYPIFGPARIHLFVAPAYLLLVARGLAILPRRARLAAVAALLPLMIQGLVDNTYAPGLKTDYRALARWLRSRPHDRPVAVVVHDHDPLFPYTQVEAARYYLGPNVEVVLENGDQARPPVIRSTNAEIYHAYCFPAAGWTSPREQEPIGRFYGLAVTRELGSGPWSR